MKKNGLILIGAVAALVVLLVAATQLFDNSARSTISEPDATDQRLVVQSLAPSGTPVPSEASGEQPGAFDSSTLSDNDTFYSGGAPVGAPVPAAGGVGGGNGLPLPQLASLKIVRSATITLTVETVRDSVAQVETIAAGAGGFVSESSLFVQPPQEGEDATPEPRRTESATIKIRVPADSYTSVMQQLRDLGTDVDAETSTTSDVTEEFTDLNARLHNLEATEVRYLELLGKADEIGDILTVQDRINAVRLEIEQVQGRMNLLNDLTDLATITVQLQPPAAEPAEEPSQKSWAEDAVSDAWEKSEEALKELGRAGIIAGVVAVWVLVPGVALLGAWRLFGPRRERSGEA